MAAILTFKAKGAKAPTAKMRKVTPGGAGQGRKTNKEIGRNRDHLTPDEVERLMKAAANRGRYGDRDRTLILVAYRHGLRVSELVGLEWADVDFKAARLHVRRLKDGDTGTHPIEGDELRALRTLRRDYPDSPWIFVTERGGPMTRSTVSKMLAEAGKDAGIPFPVTPHQLRHATGYYLANRGVPTRTIQSYLGHKNIANTARYTALAAGAFKNLWK